MFENELQPIINAFENILNIPDESFTEEVTNSINNNLESLFSVTRSGLVEQLRASFKKVDGQVTKNELQEIVTILKNEIDDYLDSLTITNQNKKKVINYVANYFYEMLDEASEIDRITIGFNLIHSNARIPTYAHITDVGADIYLPEDITVPPNARGFMVHTGLKMVIPDGWEIQIRPRSGMSAKTPLRVSNCIGTIDPDYRGEVCVLFDNLSDEPYEIKAGERIAQMILEKNYRADFKQVDTVEPTTDRGEGGFGSSGN